MDTGRYRARWLRARRAAEAYDGLLSRSMLCDLDIDSEAVERAAQSSRWKVHGRQTVALHVAELSDTARCWRAIWEVGVAIAALDGASSLTRAGLTGFDDGRIHVSVPHPCRPLAVSGVQIHRIRGWSREQLAASDLPRVRTELAAVRAASWATSDRQAALVLCMVAQQRISTASRLAGAAERHQGRRGRLVRDVVGDLATGVQSLGELDFARLCRRRGLPEPSRQVVRRGPGGRIYLDVCWEDIGLTVEIDGAHHSQGMAAVDDNLRQNSVALGGGVVLRVGVIGLRIAEDVVMGQVVEAHRLLTARARSRVGVKMP